MSDTSGWGMRTVSTDGADDRALTGVAGLDDILAGGLSRARIYVVEGTPGTGKTTLALQFLFEGRRLGERGMYVTLSETADELRASAASHGWSLDGISVVEMLPEAAFDAEQEQTLLHPADFDLGEATGRILGSLGQERPERLVLDSLAELRLLAQTPLRYRRQILALKNRLRSLRCTALLLDDMSGLPQDLQLQSIAHGVIVLEQSTSRYGAERRSLRVVKVRGIKFRGGYHDYTIETGGLAVYPRLVSEDYRYGLSSAPVATGIAGLDALLGGGLVPGTNSLVMGPTGTGKTSATTQCILAALERGEPAAIFKFGEDLATFFARSAGLGMDLRPHLDMGRLQVHQFTPAELSPGQFVHYVRRAVETDGVRAVLIDSLNNYLNAMPNEEYLIIQMHELLSYLNQHGIVTLLVLGQHGLVGDLRADVDLSYLSDTIILMRYFEVAGALRRCLSVVKTRTSDHEPTIREFSLGPGGVTIGAVLNQFDGVLGGSPVCRGGTGALMETMQPAPAPRAA
jgi:circadian clock protein KaiC